jgi:hypothetical protein
MTIKWNVVDRSTGKKHQIMAPGVHRNREGCVKYDSPKYAEDMKQFIMHTADVGRVIRR